MKDKRELSLDEVKQFFNDRPAIAIQRFAHEAGISPDTIHRMLLNQQRLTRKTEEILLRILPKYGYRNAKTKRELSLDEVKQFFKDKPAIAVQRLAKEIGISPDTLYNILIDKQAYSEKTEKALLKVLPKYGYRKISIDY